MIINLEAPPMIRSENKDIEIIASYLFRTMETLNTVLNGLTPEVVEENGRKVRETQGRSTETVTNGDDFDTLRSIIIKTANIVRSEMDTLFTSLSGVYVAQSEFGTYSQETNAAIQANSMGITQNYEYLNELQSISADHEVYINQTQAYVRTGLIDDSGGTPVYGVEIGQNSAGESPMKARFVPNRLGFWQGDTEVAYISDGMWHSGSLEVEGNITMHGDWVLSASDAFEINYVG